MQSTLKLNKNPSEHFHVFLQNLDRELCNCQKTQEMPMVTHAEHSSILKEKKMVGLMSQEPMATTMTIK